MPFATLNGVRLHYETYGDGSPVLLISGLSAPGVNWLFQVRDLARRHRVITLDNRGVGESQGPETPLYAIATMAEDAAALLRHLAVGRAHVVGASMGGTIAMELAIRHPALVRSLALCCTWAAGDGRFLHTIRSWMTLAPSLTLEDRFRHLIMPWVYSPAFLGDPERVAEAVSRALAYPFPTRAEAIQRQGQGLLEWNGTRLREIRRIRVPALVLVGRDDILTPPAFSRALAALLRKATLKVLPGGHGFFIEEAERVNRALLAFFAGVEG